MHVLYLLDSLLPGGAEQSLTALAPRLVEAGVTLDVAYLHDRPGLQQRLSEAGATLICLAGPGGRLGWIRRTRRVLLARRPNLIHTTLFEADLTGRIAGVLARVPITSSLVNMAYGPEQFADPRLSPWKLRAARSVDIATARTVRRFHALSQAVAEVMGSRLRIAADRIDVIPRGRDPQILGTRSGDRAARIRSALDLRPDTTLLLTAGRQEYQKGQDVLLEAMPAVLAAHPTARLVMAGREGNDTARLRSIHRRLGLGDSVRFLGNRSDIPDLLAAADVFVFPSRWEGLGSVLLEAMALEAPIVASDLPAIREVVLDGVTARLTPVGDPVALARAIQGSLADTDAAKVRARQARRAFLERFTLERVTDETLEFFDRALRTRPREEIDPEAAP